MLGSHKTILLYFLSLPRTEGLQASLRCSEGLRPAQCVV
ncbi:hypothetical protein Laurelin_BL5005 [Xanthomonas phage Laurelin]|nr:hypothetical protein Laurelin_BL5005 [Xanthomonas phage Laurelin]